MVVVDGRREGREIAGREHRMHGRRQARVGQLADEEVEKTLQLGDVAPRLGRERGWIDNPGVNFLAKFLDLEVTDIWETATFYSMLNVRPVGRHHIERGG